MKKLMNKLGFDFSHLRGDLFGGITAGIVALPLALAFGLQSGLGAAAGLYGAIFIGFFASLFGGTNTQISGPTAPMTAVSMVVIAGIVAANEGDLEKAIPAILIVFLISGLFQIVLGVLKIGKYVRYIPYPVVSGFMSGIGVIIIITQLLPLFGYYPKEDAAFVNSFIPEAEEVLLERILKNEVADDILVLEDFKQTVRQASNISQDEILREARALAANNSAGVLGALKMMGKAIKNINWNDLVMALITIFIIYGFKRITKKIPSTLVALVVVTIGAIFLLPEYRTIGTIPSGFPILQYKIFGNFSVSQVLPYLFTAMSLALLGAIDSLLTSIVADNKTKTKHKPNKELIGQGIGNTVASLFGGIPGAGATIRTVVNIESGGKTKLSGMIASVLILVILISLSPLASKIPAAVLAGILFTVGIGVMDYKGLAHMSRLPKDEVAVMLIVLTLTVFVGLIEAVGIGLILSSLLFMKKFSDIVEQRSKSAPIKEYKDEIPWADEIEELKNIGDKVFIKHLDGPLFFGFASSFQEMARAMPEVEAIVIRMDKVPYVDQSGIYVMKDAIEFLVDNGKQVLITDLHGQPQEMFERFDIVPRLVHRDHCFPDFRSCALWLKDYIHSHPKIPSR